ncbi:MAG: ROK family transcriptional regulator [Kiritimatiellia bacterium]
MIQTRDPAEAVPALLRKINFRKVLDAMQTLGPCSRAQLTRKTGISPPTMSILVRELVKRGLVEKDSKPPVTGVGRPGIRFRLAQKTSFVVGVVLDATSCSLAISGLNGKFDVKKSLKIPTPKNYDQLIADLVAGVETLVAAESGTFLGVGLSAPGLVDKATGMVKLASNLPILTGRTPGRDMEQRIQKPVAMLPENQAMTLAAKVFGLASGMRDFILIDVTTGTGMGAFLEGKYLSGAHGFGAEIGHITVVAENGLPCGCGNHGCLETVANDRALTRECSRHLGREVDMDDLLQLVQSGEFPLNGELEKTLDYLAIGVAAAINIFNPQLAILHGRMFELGPDVMPRLVEKIRRRSLPPAFEGCRIEHTAPNKLLAAVAGIVNHVYSSTSS